MKNTRKMALGLLKSTTNPLLNPSSKDAAGEQVIQVLVNIAAQTTQGRNMLKEQRQPVTSGKVLVRDPPNK